MAALLKHAPIVFVFSFGICFNQCFARGGTTESTQTRAGGEGTDGRGLRGGSGSGGGGAGGRAVPASPSPAPAGNSDDARGGTTQSNQTWAGSQGVGGQRGGGGGGGGSAGGRAVPASPSPAPAGNSDDDDLKLIIIVGASVAFVLTICLCMLLILVFKGRGCGGGKDPNVRGTTMVVGRPPANSDEEAAVGTVEGVPVSAETNGKDSTKA